jgi:hypothetical protein
MYMISGILGFFIPLGLIMLAAWLNEEKVWRFQSTDGYTTVGLREGPLLLLGMVWSGTTLVSIVGIASAGWLVSSTAARLGIERTTEYLSSVFLLAVASGVIVPLAAIVAAGFVTNRVPPGISTESMWLLTVIWFGMIAIAIAGLFCAAWLVRSAGAKLCHTAKCNRVTEVHRPTA